MATNGDVPATMNNHVDEKKNDDEIFVDEVSAEKKYYRNSMHR